MKCSINTNQNVKEILALLQRKWSLPLPPCSFLQQHQRQPKVSMSGWTRATVHRLKPIPGLSHKKSFRGALSKTACPISLPSDPQESFKDHLMNYHLSSNLSVLQFLYSRIIIPNILLFPGSLDWKHSLRVQDSRRPDRARTLTVQSIAAWRNSHSY